MLYWVDPVGQPVNANPKVAIITTGEDVEVVTNICCINNCMAIPESIIFIGEQLADWMILWRSNYTRECAL